MFLIGIVIAFFITFYLRYFLLFLNSHAQVPNCTTQQISFDWWKYSYRCDECFLGYALSPDQTSCTSTWANVFGMGNYLWVIFDVNFSITFKTITLNFSSLLWTILGMGCLASFHGNILYEIENSKKNLKISYLLHTLSSATFSLSRILPCYYKICFSSPMYFFFSQCSITSNY